MLAEFEELLKRTMGLDAASIGTAAIERAVQQRLAATGMKDLGAYLERARTSAEELQELIEAVIVPETWFFRDREAFATLGRIVGDDWLRTNPTGVLRVLSLPCSTGEEPYSMAMALLDAGFPPDRFRIDALDISLRSLAFARRGIYGRNSFRGGDIGFRERHFTPVASGWKLGDGARKAVEFNQGNILDAYAPGAATYDVVFCRNLLIYFDRPTQDRAMANLIRLLTPKGWLFIGPSESGLVLSHGFGSARVPLAFAFRRDLAAPSAPAASTVAAAPRRVQPARVVIAPREMPFSSVTVRTAPAVTATPKKAGGLEHAMRLADQGQLVQAAKECEAHVAAHGPSAQGFYVIGLVRDASGNHAEATEYYRKALYLDPQHHESLVHLAAVLESQGDKAGAKVMHDRARRLASKEQLK